MDEKTLIMDGFDSAILGYTILEKPMRKVLVYDYDKILQELCTQLSVEDSIEYIDYNILSAYVGE